MALARAAAARRPSGACAVLLFVGLGLLGRGAWTGALERYAARLSAHGAGARRRHGELERAVRQNLWGMWPHFARLRRG